jgi:4'-phosphopantetheinyl transferase
MDERMRAERFQFEQDRQRFIIGRGLLRTILSYYLGIEPGRLQFCYGMYGKPALAEMAGTSTLRFSLAHAHGLALYAVTCVREVGMDLEHIRPIAETEQIVDRYFSDREKAAFRALAADKKQEAFFTYWTCKEAYLKASGEGLTRPLNQIDVSLIPGEPARLLSVNGDVNEASRWTFQELRPAPDFVAALVVEGQGWGLSCWNWP